MIPTAVGIRRSRSIVPGTNDSVLHSLRINKASPCTRILYTAAHSDDNTNQAMYLCNTVRIHNHLVTPDHNV